MADFEGNQIYINATVKHLDIFVVYDQNNKYIT